MSDCRGHRVVFHDLFDSYSLDLVNIIERVGDLIARDVTTRKSGIEALGKLLLQSMDTKRFLVSIQSTRDFSTRKSLRMLSTLDCWAKTVRHRQHLITHNSVDVLCNIIPRICSDIIGREIKISCHDNAEIVSQLKNALDFSISALFALVLQHEPEQSSTRVQLVKEDHQLLAALLRLASNWPESNWKTQSMALQIVQAMTEFACFTRPLINAGAVTFLRQVALEWQLTPAFLRWSIRGLVRLVMMLEPADNLSVISHKRRLLKDMGPPIMRLCLYIMQGMEDQEILFFTIALLQELVCNNIDHSCILQLHNYVHIFTSVLTRSDADVQMYLLRILTFLERENVSVRASFVDHLPLIQRLAVCCQSGDSNVVYWSVLLVHDLVKHDINTSDVCEIVTKADLVTPLVPYLDLNNPAGEDVSRLAAETVGLIFTEDCVSTESYLSTRIISAFLSLLESSVPDISHWAAVLLLNLALVEGDAKHLLLLCGLERMLRVAEKTPPLHPAIPQILTKTLLVLSLAAEATSTLTMTLCTKGANPACLENDLFITLGDQELFQPDVTGKYPKGILLVVIAINPFTTEEQGIQTLTAFDLKSHTIRPFLLWFTNLPKNSILLLAGTWLSRNSPLFHVLQRLGVPASKIPENQNWLAVIGEGTPFQFSVASSSGEEETICATLGREIRPTYYLSTQIHKLLMVPLMDKILSTPADDQIIDLENLETLLLMMRHNQLKHHLVNDERVLPMLFERVTILVNLLSEYGQTQSPFRTEPLHKEACLMATLDHHMEEVYLILELFVCISSSQLCRDMLISAPKFFSLLCQLLLLAHIVFEQPKPTLARISESVRSQLSITDCTETPMPSQTSTPSPTVSNLPAATNLPPSTADSSEPITSPQACRDGEHADAEMTSKTSTAGMQKQAPPSSSDPQLASSRTQFNWPHLKLDHAVLGEGVDQYIDGGMQFRMPSPLPVIARTETPLSATHMPRSPQLLSAEQMPMAEFGSFTPQHGEAIQTPVEDSQMYDSLAQSTDLPSSLACQSPSATSCATDQQLPESFGSDLQPPAMSLQGNGSPRSVPPRRSVSCTPQMHTTDTSLSLMGTGSDNLNRPRTRSESAPLPRWEDLLGSGNPQSVDRGRLSSIDNWQAPNLDEVNLQDPVQLNDLLNSHSCDMSLAFGAAFSPRPAVNQNATATASNAANAEGVIASIQAGGDVTTSNSHAQTKGAHDNGEGQIASTSQSRPERSITSSPTGDENSSPDVSPTISRLPGDGEEQLSSQSELDDDHEEAQRCEYDEANYTAKKSSSVSADCPSKSALSEHAENIRHQVLLILCELGKDCTSGWKRDKFWQCGAAHLMWAELSADSTGIELLPGTVKVSVEAALGRLFHCLREVFAPVSWVELEQSTPSVTIAMDKMKTANAHWTFETVHSSHPVNFFMNGDQLVPNGWYYEVTVLSPGLMQLGWTRDISVFAPMKGFGVGDDECSFAFDGRRCRAWNGFWRYVTYGSTARRFHGQCGEPYGRHWEVGDVISCLLLRTGRIHFWLNGEDLGQAFSGVNVNQAWYAAGSLSMDQSCRFNFGVTAPFRYRPPAGCWPVGDVLNYHERVINDSLDMQRETMATQHRSRRDAVSHTPLSSPDPHSVDHSVSRFSPVLDLINLSKKAVATENGLYYSFRITNMMISMQCEALKFGWMCFDGSFELAAVVKDDGYLYHPSGDKILLGGDGHWTVFTSAVLLAENEVTFFVDGQPAGRPCQLPSRAKAINLCPLIVGSRFSLNGCGDWPNTSVLNVANSKKTLAKVLRRFAARMQETDEQMILSLC